MTDIELKSCIGTIEMLRRLHGVMNVIDAGNCEKIIKVLSDIPKYKDAYNKGWDDGAKATYEHLKMCEEEQEPKWIPVSERLPEHYQNILFSTKTDRVFEGRYFKDETEHQWYSFRDECFAWNNVVTAWMPLPKSYEPQERSDKE